ncbi:hypothetical protein BC826DRAFT_976891 [Russula brevipes]|nr:hypothetical protein BC826DRAFT_976891 [Russula brevipes]
MSNSSTHGSSIANQSNSGNRIVSPIPSLRRARARALTIGGTSGYSRQEQKELEGGVRTQGSHSDEPPDEDDRWDLRSRESPFSSRVKEKLRQVHAYDEESPREPFKQAVRLPALLDTLPARASYVDGDGPLHRTKHLHIRNAKSRSLMGPRERKVAPPGSVMDRVRSIEGRGSTKADLGQADVRTEDLIRQSSRHSLEDIR